MRSTDKNSQEDTSQIHEKAQQSKKVSDENENTHYSEHKSTIEKN